MMMVRMMMMMTMMMTLRMWYAQQRLCAQMALRTEVPSQPGPLGSLATRTCLTERGFQSIIKIKESEKEKGKRERERERER